MKKLLIFLLLLLVCSCATNKTKQTQISTSTTTADTHNVSNIGKYIANSNNVNQDVWMKSSLKINFPAMNQSASAIIEISKVDSILVSISAMFGISVGKLFATSNEFIMNNNLESTTFIGTPTRENIMKAIFIDLSFNDLVCILKTITPHTLAQYSYNPAENCLIYEDEFVTESAHFSDSNALTKVIRKNLQGEEIFTVNYGKHTTKGNCLFATDIKIYFPQQNGNINILISEIDTNKKLTSEMRLTKPKSYKLIEFN